MVLLLDGASICSSIFSEDGDLVEPLGMRAGDFASVIWPSIRRTETGD